MEEQKFEEGWCKKCGKTTIFVSTISNPTRRWVCTGTKCFQYTVDKLEEEPVIEKKGFL